MSFPTLSRAPITEAIIDIRVDAPNLTLEKLDHLHAIVSDGFPEKTERVNYQTEIPADAGSTKTTKTVLGWVATSPDKSSAMEARLDGFTYVKLAPYANWAALSDDARRLWSLYADAVQPDAVTRLTVRFLNRIEIPKDLRDFFDYFRTFPQIGPDLPQGISGMVARVLIPFGESTATITQIIDITGVTDLVIPIVFDIDVSKIVKMSPAGDELWEVLDRLRDIKNNVFFGSITEKTKELFQ